MKTSFYFVLWILIYPILGLLNNDFVNNNAFVVALAAVWGFSWVLNRSMPKTLTYERVSQIAPILEDVYTGNVESFRKRLSREAMVETITSVYFLVTVCVILFAIIKAGVNDWVALIVFGFFTFGAVSRSSKLMKAKSELNNGPTAERCMEISDETYQLDYASYYEAHEGRSYQDMLPPRPANYKAFQITSMVIATVCSLLGLLYLVLGIAIMIKENSAEAFAFSGMYILYGSLATYFGVKDVINIFHTFKKPANQAIPTQNETYTEIKQ